MNQADRMELNARHLASLEGNIFNERVGEFFYRHREANPKWYAFFDKLGNSVFYGGDATDVIIRIKEVSREELGNLLIDYMRELVGRHNEDLHGEGTKKFHAVTITLPVGILKNGGELEVTIHTGSGCCYDQDEIAYEVMAALSGIPVYKALAPSFSYHSFVRQDKVGDGKPISYWFEEEDICVSFGYLNDGECVRVSKDKPSPSQSTESLIKFVEIMQEVLSVWVEALTDKKMSRVPGFIHCYEYEPHSLNNNQKYVRVFISSSFDCSSFAIEIPYFSHIDFGRITFAKEVMERLSEAFPVAKEEGVEFA